MCGISGFKLIRSKNVDYLRKLKKITQSINHRGPDALGFWNSINDSIFLGHTRLSILDLSKKGNQPMHSYCGRYVISYNGEIYNFKEIRLFIEKKFKTNFQNNTDTQVLLELISHLGVYESLKKVEGMFAFSLWDKREKKLILARDRFGEKPLFYYFDTGLFLFGSELKVIKEFFDNKQLKISSKSAKLYSLLGYIPAPRSIYENTFKVMPSEIIEFKNHQITKKKYYAINNNAKYSLQSYSELKDKIKNSLETSVKKMMVADVEVGCFLSGGVDSSLVAMLMQKNSAKKIRTFTVGFNEKEYDESDYARKVADAIGTNHEEIKVKSNDMFNHLEQIVDIFDEPFSDSSFIPTFLISKLASEKVKVVLSGDGGDEVFLGYNRYLLARKINKFKNLSPKSLRKFIRIVLKLIPSKYYDEISRPFQKLLGIHAFSHKIEKLSNILDFENNSEFYKKLNSLDNEVLEKILSQKTEFFNDYDEMNLVESVQRNDIDFYLPNDILVKVDRSSMKNSLEVRSPFLNHKLVEDAFCMAQEIKLKNNSTKYILKDILSDLIPKNFVNRPKMGFAIPIERWIKNKEFKKRIEEIFYDSNWENFGWEKKGIIDKWDKYKKYNSLTPQCIWTYAVAGIWLNKN